MKKILFVMPLMAISLIGCNKGGGDTPEPTTVKHKLHFNGVDCILLDENKKQVTEDKEFVSGQIIYYFIAGKNIEYDVPKQDIVNVTLTDGGEFSDTWRYSETDGSITIKMTADVTINARSVMRPVDDFKVNEQEMKDAYAMKDVEYLQAVVTNNITPELSCKMELTPSSFRMIRDNSSAYAELLIFKDGNVYHQYVKTSKESAYIPTEYSGTYLTIADFINSLEFNILKEKDYGDFYYSDTKKEYVALDITSDDELTIKFWAIQFYKKKVVNVSKVYEQSPIIEDASFSLSYDKIEPPSPTI